MKGLILSGGSGTGLRPITHTSAKQLVPVANKPILFYGIEAMAAAGITDIAIVIAPGTGADVRAAVGDGSRFGVGITWIVQSEPLGLAHCVRLARSFLADDDFVMYLGDNMLEQGLGDLVERFRAERSVPLEPKPKPDSVGPDPHRPKPVAARILLAEVEDPQRFGVAELSATGEVVRLVEKPAEPPSELALVGVYLFSPEIHEAAAAIEPSGRGELEITDAIGWLIDNGRRVVHEVLDGWWMDTGKKDPLLACNRLILDTISRRVEGEVDGSSRLEGSVVIEAGAMLVNSTIRGPVVIGTGTRIVDSHVGSYCSLGPDCTVTASRIDNSVVLAGASVTGVEHLTDSLVGRHSRVGPGPGRPGSLRLLVGDHCQVELR